MLEGANVEVMDAFEYKKVMMETKMGNFHFASRQAHISEVAIRKFHFHLDVSLLHHAPLRGSFKSF